MGTKPVGRNALHRLYQQKDLLWFVLWLGGLGILFLWDLLFLNSPAFARVQAAFLNSLFTGAMVVVFALLLGWSSGIGMHLLGRSGSRFLFSAVSLILDLFRSIPQILVVLIGYVLLTILVGEEVIRSSFFQLLWISVVIALAVFQEVADTVQSRIEYFRTLDFVDAMLCCGISEWRILNVEILWKNSRAHLLHKLISIFGVTIFLQCSIDFIVSVGLSTDVSLTNFPLTLGSLLANIDSKQDILALSNLLTDPGYLPYIFGRHLQGISVAWCIVFTLLCIYMIANALVRQRRLA